MSYTELLLCVVVVFELLSCVAFPAEDLNETLLCFLAVNRDAVMGSKLAEVVGPPVDVVNLQFPDSGATAFLTGCS